MSLAAPQRPQDGPAPAATPDEAWVEEARALRDKAQQGFEPAAAPRAEGQDRRGPFRPSKLVPTRSRLNGRGMGRFFRLTDAFACASFAISAAHVASPEGLLSAPVGAVAPFVLAVAVLVWSLGVVRGYGFSHREGFVRHLLRVSAALGLTGLLLAGAMTVLPATAATLGALKLWFALAFAGLVLLHAVWWVAVHRWRSEGRLAPNIVIVGVTDNARQIIETLLKTREAQVLGIFDDRIGRVPDQIAGVPVLGDTGALLTHKVMPYVDRIVITVPAKAQARVRQLIERLSVLPNEISLVVETGADAARAVSRIANSPMTQVSGEPADERRALIKRAQDLVVGVTALVLGLPIMAAIAVAIRLDSPGPVFFRQRRHGFNNEEIQVWKFRSMRQEAADHAATRQVSADDERVTKVGRFIRRTSLDELPQLLNVLKGEMSLVGPRPHAVGMKTGQTESARLVAEYAHRHRMKPGMTGWAAIHGSRGPIDTPELVRRRVALDIEYIERQSFWLDLYIMAMTIPCLLGDVDTVR